MWKSSDGALLTLKVAIQEEKNRNFEKNETALDNVSRTNTQEIFENRNMIIDFYIHGYGRRLYPFDSSSGYFLAHQRKKLKSCVR